jgi:hypothetical protein
MSKPAEPGAPRETLQQVVDGFPEAWRSLQEQILPQLERWARSHPNLRRKGLARSEDDLREVVLVTLERLRAADFRNLRNFLASTAESTVPFESWLYGALDFTVREHLRHRFGRVGRRRAGGDPAVTAAEADVKQPKPGKRDLNTFAARFEEELFANSRTGLTWKVTLREVLAYAEAQFTPLESRALRTYVEAGASYEELRDELGLADASEAERLIRRLKERLRVRFRDAE